MKLATRQITITTIGLDRDDIESAITAVLQAKYPQVITPGASVDFDFKIQSVNSGEDLGLESVSVQVETISSNTPEQLQMFAAAHADAEASTTQQLTAEPPADEPGVLESTTTT